MHSRGKDGTAMRVCLFEDHLVEDLQPLTSTRPVFDLLCGLTNLGSKQFRWFGVSSRAVVVRPAMELLLKHRQPDLHVNDPAWTKEGPFILVNGRWLPPSTPRNETKPHVGLVGDEIAYVHVSPSSWVDFPFEDIQGFLDICKKRLPQQQVGGRMVRHLWELVHLNGPQLVEDARAFGLTGADSSVRSRASIPHVVGPPDGLVIDPTAHIDPLVVADTTSGPVVVEQEVVITAFTRLEGPCYIGRGTHLHGAKVRAGTTLGPACRIGGEVECSIVQGYSNKYHDGFLGHAYLGEWVNIGAGTNNSDLRNDYGEVVMIVGGKKVPTGLTKVGCFLGDHTKTGLATQLNTGTIAGTFCNILPGPGYAPRSLPSFTNWFKGELIENGSLAQLIDTARTVMRRRQQTMSDELALLYRTLFEKTAADRRATILQRAADGLRKAS